MPESNPKDHRPFSTGQKIELILENSNRKDITTYYTLGQADATAECVLAQKWQGFTIKSGEVVLASGHWFHALMQLDTDSSYENWGIAVAALEGGQVRLLWQDDDEFEDRLAAIVRVQHPPGAPLQVYPYRYHYYDHSDAERDHHVGDDGWS